MKNLMWLLVVAVLGCSAAASDPRSSTALTAPDGTTVTTVNVPVLLDGNGQFLGAFVHADEFRVQFFHGNLVYSINPVTGDYENEVLVTCGGVQTTMHTQAIRQYAYVSNGTAYVWMGTAKTAGCAGWPLVVSGPAPTKAAGYIIQ